MGKLFRVFVAAILLIGLLGAVFRVITPREAGSVRGFTRKSSLLCNETKEVLVMLKSNRNVGMVDRMGTDRLHVCFRYAVVPVGEKSDEVFTVLGKVRDSPTHGGPFGNRFEPRVITRSVSQYINEWYKYELPVDASISEYILVFELEDERLLRYYIVDGEAIANDHEMRVVVDECFEMPLLQSHPMYEKIEHALRLSDREEERIKLARSKNGSSAG